MPISVTCTCGKTLSVKDELAGKRGKCPACGTMLTIPQPAKPNEPEEWGLVPLDDEPKPVKTAPAKPAVAKSVEKAAKPQANAPTKPAPNKPAPALLADDFGLAPLDDEPAKPVVAKPAANVVKPQATAPAKSVTSKPAPALLDDDIGLAPLEEEVAKSVKPSPQRPKPAVKPMQPAVKSAPTAPAVPAAKNKLGGAAPAMLDLPPLEEEAKPTARKPGTSTAGSVQSPAATVATPAAKNLGGAAPAPLDLPTLEGGEDLNHASWIDEGAETEFKLDGPALKAPAGTFTTPVAAATARTHDEPEGEISCPRCGARLKRSLTVWNLPIRLLFGRMIILFFGTPAQFKCKGCGPVHYEELNGPSRRAAGIGVQHLLKTMALSFLIVSSVGFILFKMFETDPHREFRERMERENAERNERYEEMNQRARERGPSRPMTQQEIEAMKKRSEERRRESEERIKKMREQSTQPTLPRPNPQPSPITPTTPKATPSPTSMPAKNPFEETTLPSKPEPKPMPVNPFEETTVPPTPAPTPMSVNPFQPID